MCSAIRARRRVRSASASSPRSKSTLEVPPKSDTNVSCYRALVISRVFEACDPSNEALVTRTQHLTYGELDALCAKATGALAAMGITAGDRVAACLPNEVAVVVAFHATMRLGAIWVGVNKALAPPEKQFILN